MNPKLLLYGNMMSCNFMRKRCASVIVWPSAGIAMCVTALVIMELTASSIGQPFVVPIIESVLGPICHHLPERTLRFSEPLPVCARCTGMYLGWLLGCFGAILCTGSSAHLTKRTLWVLATLGTFLYLIAITEPSLEMLGFFHVGNYARLVFGIPLGFAPGFATVLAVKALLQTPGADELTYSSNPPTPHSSIHFQVLF